MREYQKVPFLSAADASGAAVETPQEGRSPEVIIDALESMVVSLERLIANRSADELRQAGRDGGWGAVEVLAHMRDWTIRAIPACSLLFKSVQVGSEKTP
jgi:hypothetical protein